MLKGILEFFGIYEKKVESKVAEVKNEVKAEIVKTEEVVAKLVKCGCGRSPTGNCMGLHKLSVEEWAKHELNPVIAKVEAVIEKTEEAVKKAVKPKKPRASKKNA